MIKNKLKLFSVLILFIISIIAISGFVSAAEMEGLFSYDADHDVSIGVEVNDVYLTQDDRKNIEKTDELDVLVTLQFDGAAGVLEPQDIEGVVVEATITSDGHNKDRVSEVSREFKAKLGDIYDERFKLKLPLRMEQDLYTLKIRIDDNIASQTFFYPIRIDAKDHLLEIKDIILSPEDTVKAGRALLVSARIKNRGESEEEDVKIKASIPELGISASDYIDEVDEEDCTDEDCDDSVTSGTLYLRIPDDAKTGDYTLRFEVEYEDGDETETKTTTIHVIGAEELPVEVEVTKTIITIGPEKQELTKGVAAMYTITLTNAGTSARTYTIEADSADWAEFKISPSNVVVLDPSESKAVYVYVTAKDTAPTGEQMFSVTVKSKDKVLKQVPLKADVKEAKVEAPAGGIITRSRVEKALWMGLVVLVILLVILGLIIGFNKLKGEEEEGKEKESGETYY